MRALHGFALGAVALLLAVGCSSGGSGGGGTSSGTSLSGTVSVPGSPARPGSSALPGSSARPGAGGVALAGPRRAGEARVGAAVSGATVEIRDIDGDLVSSTTTDSSGNYTINVPDGSYTVGILAGSMENFTPLSTSIIVGGGVIRGATTSGTAFDLDMEAPAAAQTISGTVTAAGSAASGVSVEFVDRESGLIRFAATTDGTGSFAVATLPAGGFIVRLDPDSLPAGYAAPTPVKLAVTSNAVTPSSLAFVLPVATVLGGLIETSSGVSPVVEFTPEGNPVRPPRPANDPLTVPAGAEIVVIEAGIGEIDTVPIDTNGSYDLNLRDGTYVLEFTGLGDTVVLPPPLLITVNEGLVYIEGQDTPVDPDLGGSLGSVAPGITSTLTGIVTIAGAGVLTRVSAADPSTGGTVAFGDTDATGAYSINLADGAYDVFIEPSLLPPGVVPPEPVRVSVEFGNDPAVPIKEQNGVENDGAVDFAFASSVASLTGTVTDSNGDPLHDVRIAALKGEDVVGRAVTDGAGAYTLELPLGTVAISVDPEGLPATLLSPDVQTMEIVSAAGVISIFGAAGAITTLDSTLEERLPNFTGTITFDFDADGTVEPDETVGARFIVTEPGSDEILLDGTSDPEDGQGSLVLGDGSFEVRVDPESCPPGTAPPPPFRMSVDSSGVTTEDGTTNSLVSLDFTLVAQVAALTGTVTLDGNAVLVGVELVDSAGQVIIGDTRTDPATGDYRLPVFPGTFDLRVATDTLPPGVASPAPVFLSVAEDGTISTATATVTTVNFSLTRTAAELTGVVAVDRGGASIPVEVGVDLRDPQTHNVVFSTRTDGATGGYVMTLSDGSWEIAVDPQSVPPGVVPPLPVTVSVSGTTIEGDGVASNALDFTFGDVRTGGVDVTGLVYNADDGTGMPSEVRLYDPRVGSAEGNFILSVFTDASGSYSLRATDGTYELAVLPRSLPPGSVVSAPATLSIREGDSSPVNEENTLFFAGSSANAEDDATINFSVRTSAGSAGITVAGAVSFTAGGTTIFLGGAQIRIFDSSTGSIIAFVQAGFGDGRYIVRMPLGSYVMDVNPSSIPFDLIPPAQVNVLATTDGVSTDGGVAVTPTAGEYIFDFAAINSTQTLGGTVSDSSANPVFVFVELIDGRDGRYIFGRWTDPSTGNYLLNVSPGTYKVQVSGPSVPFGFTAPAPVAATVTDSSVIEESGTENDGDVDFALSSADQTISGTVGDSGANPLPCFVVVTDASSGAFISGSPANPFDGSYALSVPTGTFNVAVDPPSLPPGFPPPPPSRVQITSGSNATVSFTIGAASDCITGTVLSATSLQPLPVFVALDDASTGRFIAGAPARFEDGSFRICAGTGSYTLRIDANTLPPGLVVPAPVAVQVNASGILEENTEGTGNGQNDGEVNFRIIEPENLASTIANLTGTVTVTDGTSTFPLGAFVIVEDANTGYFISGGPTNPGTGDYSIYISAGTYNVFLDGRQIPPGVPVPAPIRITISGTTITQLIEGVPVQSSALDFSLVQGSATELTGTVTRGGTGVPCFVMAIDSTNDFRVAGAPTGPTGGWAMALADGSYIIAVDPYSLPPGSVPPAGVDVTISNGFAGESAGTANDGVIPIVLTQAAATLTGFIQDDAGGQLFSFVQVINPSDGRFIGGAPTFPGNDFSIPLSDGAYDVVVDHFSLPFDVSPPIPSRITVTGSSIALTSAGSGAFVSPGRLRITATRQSQGATVAVTVEDSSGNPRPALVHVKDSIGNILFHLHVPPNPIGINLILAPGNYSLSIDPFSVPPGFSLPSAVSVTVSGSPAAAVPSTVNLVLTNEQVTLTGTISNAVTGGNPKVALDLYNGEGFRIRSGIPLTPSGSSATYSVVLSEGTYELSLRRAAGFTPVTVVLPRNVPVTVADAAIQNPDDDSGQAGTQVNVAVPVVEATISGTVTLASSGVGGLRVGVLDPVDYHEVNSTLTNGSGVYTLGLPAGFYRLGADPASLYQIAPSAFPPQPFDLNVSTVGDIEVVDQSSLCAGSNPSESCTGVDFALQAFNASVNAQVIGTVRARRTSSDPLEPVPSALVHIIDPSTKAPWASAFTLSDGSYVLFAPEGAWSLVLDHGTVNVSYPTIPAAPVQIGVFGNTVTEDNTTGTGNAIDDGEVNFVVSGASALVQGRVQTSDGTGIGTRLVISSSDVTEMPFGFVHSTFTDPSGNYFLPMGLGSFKLWVDAGALPPGFLPPAPTVFSVSGTSITEDDVAGAGNGSDDGVINPLVIAAGGLIYGRLIDSGASPLPGFVGLLVPSSNPNEPSRFVSGSPVDPATGNFTLTAGDGSFFIEVDPYSMPPGLQAPARVNVSVATSGSTTTVTYDATATTVADGSLTRVLLTASAAAGEVRGTIADSVGNPLGSFLVVEDAGSGMFIRGTPTDPSTGMFRFFLGDGAYDLRVDPPSLPPGTVPPLSVRVSVSGSTITEENTDGTDPVGGAANQADDGVVNFSLAGADASLTGYVRFSTGNGAFARVGLFAADSAGNYEIFVNGSNADPVSGFFSIGCNAGTYRVDVDPGSVPPGALAPEAVVISVAVPSGGPATFTFPSTATTVIESGVERLILTLRSSTGGAVGAVTLGGNGVPVFVIAEDASTHQFINGSPTAPDGTYMIFLPPGTFDVFPNSFSLPYGVVPPAPERVNVTDSVVTGVDFALAQAGVTLEGYVLLPDGTIDVTSPNINCSTIQSNVNVAPIACGVDLFIPSQDSNSPPTFLGSTYSNPMDGHFAIPLADGTYELAIFGGSLPPGVLPPSPVTLSVAGTTITASGVPACTNDATQIILFVGQSAASLSGRVVTGSGPSTFGLGVFIEVIDPTDGSFFTGQPTNPSDGSFNGTPSGDGTLDWVLANGEGHITGQLTLNGNPANGEIIVFNGPQEVTFSFAFGGTYDLFLPAGNLTVTAELDNPPPGATPPAPFNANVTAGGQVEEFTQNFNFTSP